MINREANQAACTFKSAHPRAAQHCPAQNVYTDSSCPVSVLLRLDVWTQTFSGGYKVMVKSTSPLGREFELMNVNTHAAQVNVEPN